MPTVIIDKAWLSCRPAGPKILDQANTDYKLDVDITDPASALVVAGTGKVALLGGQHTITYNDCEPVVVPNGGFEDGAKYWDLSSAKGCIVAPARPGMWGSNMLSFPVLSGPVSLISSQISVPVVREYAAVVTVKGSQTAALVTVLDASSGRAIGTGKRDSNASGYGIVVKFSPISSGIQIKIALTPVPGKAANADLDYVSVMAFGDFGVIASPSGGQFPAHLQYLAPAVKKAGAFNLYDTNIIQGNGRGYGCDALFAVSCKGLEVENCKFSINGMDTQNIDAKWANSGIEISHSILTADVDRIGDRTQIYSAIKLSRNSGDVTVKGNNISGCPQAGINADTNTNGQVTISDNYISCKAIASNPYGICVSGVKDFIISGNTINSENGRGIDLDSYSKVPSERGEIFGNIIDVRQTPNLEYGASAMAVTGFRIRNWGVPQKGLDIHHNNVSVYTDEQGLHEACAIRVKQENPDGVADNSGNVIRDNVFRAVTGSPSKNFYAASCVLSGVSGGTGLQFLCNDFQSNCIGVQIGDSDSAGKDNQGVDFVGNTFTRLTDGAATSYVAIQAGDNNNSSSNIRFIDSKYVGGASEKIKIVGAKPQTLQMVKTVTASTN